MGFYFNYIAVVSYIGGGSRSTRKMLATDNLYHVRL